MPRSHRKKPSLQSMTNSPSEKRSIYQGKDILRGLLIYASGDSIAALIQDEFLFSRLLGMMVIGSTIYALEIPNYFRWIDKVVPAQNGYKSTLKRTALAILYFNPLWIARHLLFIKIFIGNWNGISWNLLYIGLLSFLVNIPISLIANFIIQNKIRLSWRFFASAVFSAMMAIYYALSELLFN